MGRVTEEFCDRCGEKLDGHARTWIRKRDYKTCLMVAGHIDETNDFEWDLCPDCAKSLNAWLHREVEMRG